ncbi:diguanylate cyclase/phosphodiesterase with PAS/PAC and GAF sensor [Campylobacter geochelonis]|nr:diguanylate cyclase/phosphodiesterase with PAS/PAC and GAF sensor [Campylobacter geochelonis]
MLDSANSIFGCFMSKSNNANNIKNFYILVVLFMLFVIMFATFCIYKESISTQKELQSNAKTINTFISKHQKNINNSILSLNSDIINSINYKEILNLIEQNNSDFDALFFIDSNETFSLLLDKLAYAKQINLASKIGAKSLDLRHLSVVIDNKQSNFVVKNLGEEKQIIAFYNLFFLKELASSIKRENLSSFLIVDEDFKNVIFASDDKLYQNKLNLDLIYEKKIIDFNDQKLHFSKNSINGEWELFVINRLIGYKYFVLSYINLSDVIFKNIAFLSSLALLFLSIVLFFMFVRYKFIKPLNELKSVLKNVCANFDEASKTFIKSKKFGEISTNIAEILKEIERSKSSAKSEKNKFEYIFKSDLVAILLVDSISSKIIQANQYAKELYGYGEDILKMYMFDLSDERPYNNKENALNYEYEKSGFVLQKHKSSKQKELFLRVYKTYAFINGRNLTIYIMSDVTCYEQFCIESKSQIQMLEGSPLLSIEYDFSIQKVVFITDNVEEILGYEKEDFLENRVKLSNIIYQNGIKIFPKLEKLFSDGLNSQKPKVLSCKLQHKDRFYRGFKVFLKASNTQKSHATLYFENIDEYTQKEASYIKELKRYENIIDAASFATWEWDLEKDMMFFSKKFLSLLKSQEKECETVLDYEKFRKLIHPKDLELFDKKIKDHINGFVPKFGVEVRILSKDNKFIYMSMQGAVLEKDLKGNVKFLCGTIEDISQRKQSEYTLRLIASVFSNSHEGIFITDSKGEVIHINKAFERITGYEEKEIIGKKSHLLNENENSIKIHKEINQAVKENGYWHGEIWDRRKNGEVYPEILTINAIKNERDELHYMGIFLEITSLKEKESRLEKIAHYDHLTKLPNRLLFENLASKFIKELEDKDGLIAILFIDFDGFKDINDKFGHEIGDIYLQKISQSLKEALRSGDIIARLGGDEFGVVVTNLSTKEELGGVLTRLITAAKDKFSIADNENIGASASIGVSFYPQDEKVTFSQLLKQADKAMYRAKTTARASFHIYTKDDYDIDTSAKSEKGKLEFAIKNGDFFVLFQPVLNASENKIDAFEILLRFKDRNLAIVEKRDFLDEFKTEIALKTLGIFTIKEAIKFWFWYKNSYKKEIFIEVGVCVRELCDNDFYKKFSALLDENLDFNPSFLRILIDDLDEKNYLKFTQTAHNYAKFNIEFILNNADLKSLKYIKNLPIKTVKTDINLCFGMTNSYENLRASKAIAMFVSKYNLKNVAKGLQSVAIKNFFGKLGYEYLQGDYISGELRQDEIASFIKRLEDEKNFINIAEEDFIAYKAALKHKEEASKFLSFIKSQNLERFDIKNYEKEYKTIFARLDGVVKSEILELHTELHKQILDILTCKFSDESYKNLLKSIAKLNSSIVSYLKA